MKHPFFHDRKANFIPAQWYIYFSSILIQIKVIAQTFGERRDFSDMHFLRNTIKNGGNVICVKDKLLKESATLCAETIKIRAHGDSCNNYITLLQKRENNHQKKKIFSLTVRLF